MALLDLFAFFEEEASAVLTEVKPLAKLDKFLHFMESPILAPAQHLRLELLLSAF